MVSIPEFTNETTEYVLKVLEKHLTLRFMPIILMHVQVELLELHRRGYTMDQIAVQICKDAYNGGHFCHLKCQAAYAGEGICSEFANFDNWANKFGDKVTIVLIVALDILQMLYIFSLIPLSSLKMFGTKTINAAAHAGISLVSRLSCSPFCMQ